MNRLQPTPEIFGHAKIALAQFHVLTFHFIGVRWRRPTWYELLQRSLFPYIVLRPCDLRTPI
jgi:hypothetical protein